MQTAEEYYEIISKSMSISSGDPVLDELLHGGFCKGPIHFLYGPKNIIALILMKTAVNFFAVNSRYTHIDHQVLYIDGENLFNPYLVSKLAVSNRLGPSFILERILVARTFTWNQMVETIEENIRDLELTHVRMILVSGMTSMFESLAQDPDPKKTANPLNSKIFHDLKHIFEGINHAIRESDPIIVLSGPTHSKSTYRPAGGKLLSHFAGVITGIYEMPRYIDYKLDQHPFLPETKIRYWKSAEIRKNSSQRAKSLKSNSKSITLDSFFKNIFAIGGKILGRTLLPFRMALEEELSTWNSFRNSLSKENLSIYEELMLQAKQHADAGSLATRPLLSEVIFMSIALEQQKSITQLLSTVENLRLLIQKLLQRL